MHYSIRTKVLMFSILATGMFLSRNANAQEQKISVGDLLKRAQTAVSRGTTINDVVVSGTVRRIAGSTDETGQGEFKALASGEASIDLVFASGSNREVYARGQRGPVGEWSGMDGKVHAIAYHNLLVDAAWFSPVLLLERASAAAEGKIVMVAEGKNSSGHPLDHLRVASPSPIAASHAAPGLPKAVVEAVQKAGQFDLYLDSATSLPVEMDFQTHPDINLGQDIPVRVRYSDYRTVNGASFPFHVQKFINNTLYLDLHFDAVSFNNGLAANSFVVTAQPSRSLPQ